MTLQEEAKLRTGKIRQLLLQLERELRWFRTEIKARENLRKELYDPYGHDVGYISSLLLMMAEEDRFQRWQALTTTRFSSFKRGRR